MYVLHSTHIVLLIMPRRQQSSDIIIINSAKQMQTWFATGHTTTKRALAETAMTWRWRQDWSGVVLVIDIALSLASFRLEQVNNRWSNYWVGYYIGTIFIRQFHCLALQYILYVHMRFIAAFMMCTAFAFKTWCWPASVSHDACTFAQYRLSCSWQL